MKTVLFILLLSLSVSAFADTGTETTTEETAQERYQRELQERQQRELEFNQQQDQQEQQSMENNAKASQNAAKQNGMINLIGGGAMVAYGISTEQYPMVIMGGMMMMQGAQNMNTAANTGNVRATFNEMMPDDPGYDSSTFTDPTWTDPFGGRGDGAGGTPTAKNLLDAAKTMGVTFNPEDGTITTPKGTIPMSAAGSAAGLASAGFDMQGAQAAENALERMKAQAKNSPRVKSMGFANYGGGGGGGSYNAAEMKDPFADLFKQMNNKNKKKVDRAVAGMSKPHHGELIGVAGDNIFQMINRRYFKKCAEGQLIGCK